MYDQRTYRRSIKDGDLVSFQAVVKETDLYIRASRDLSAVAVAAITEIRDPLERYISEHPVFLHSLEPLQVGPDAPEIVRRMAEAAGLANVGPMAAVAGAVAQMVGEKLLHLSGEVIVENGGDIYLKVSRKRVIAIFAGESEFTGKLAIEVEPDRTPLGVCTSSGRVGPSLSLGMADAAVVIAPSAALADAAATAVGNAVKSERDVDAALELGRRIRGISGIVVIAGSNMGAWGDIKLVRI
ncbi:MAG: UPF0280 family protein [Dehalococcoidia bacterium]|nr:UPF0280 family protein [Dehalococcoidia bacterium]